MTRVGIMDEETETPLPQDFNSGLVDAVPEANPETIDPNATLWEDGPTQAMVDAWKAQYGTVYVTSVTETIHIVWRTLNRFEYRRLVKLLEQAVAAGTSQTEANLNNEEAIAEMCVLFPGYSRQAPAAQLAGIASLIAQEVMETSGFVALDIREI